MSKETVRTIDCEPHWPNVRRWVVNAYLTGDQDWADQMVEAMGCEAPKVWPPSSMADAEAGR